MSDWPYTKIDFDISQGDLDALAPHLEIAGFRRFPGGEWWEWFVQRRKDEVVAQLRTMGIESHEHILIRCRPKAVS